MFILISYIVTFLTGSLTSYLILRNNPNIKQKVDVAADKGEVVFDKVVDKVEEKINK